ncbi:MAG: type II toxin-antitoxin system HicA family toxin [Chloroflexi bacterium]|nr:type II toxin-antitoxin system HicA family toxin [Chloroflexota bacterium]
MSRNDELQQRVLSGRSDANIHFDDLRSLLLRLGFAERTRGSHHIFRKNGVRELINIQRDGNHAKPYQVRQVRQVILRYHLEMGD